MNLLLALLLIAGASDTPTKDRTFKGTDVMIDFPLDRTIRNEEGKKNKQGKCVFASLSMIGTWHNRADVEAIFKLLDEGGGWPEKTEAVLHQYAPDVEIAQYEGSDMAFLDLAMTTFRPAGCTMDTGDFYRNEIIAHMIMMVHLDKDLACIIDNNDNKNFTWMTRQEWQRRIMLSRGKYWAYVLILPPPPPPLAVLRLPNNDESGDDMPVKQFVINRADLIDDRRRGLIA